MTWSELPVEVEVRETGGWLESIPTPIALTGTTGFVGSHLLDALVAAGARARVLVRDPARLGERREAVDVVTGDLTDRAALARLADGAGTVVHLAGCVRAPAAEVFDRVNRAGTEALVAATDSRARLVYVSSLAAAGPCPRPGGTKPGDTPCPVSGYGRSKLGGEEAVRSFAGDWVILRPPAIYGPRDIDVLQFFRLAARGVVPLPAGERWVTVAFVADVVRAVLAAAAAGGRHVWHVGEPEPISMASLITSLAAAGGVRARVVPVPAWLLRGAGLGGDLLQYLGLRSVALTSDKAGELLARHWASCTEGSLRALGLTGFVPFASGARHTWEWYRRLGWLPRVTITGA